MKLLSKHNKLTLQHQQAVCNILVVFLRRAAQIVVPQVVFCLLLFQKSSFIYCWFRMLLIFECILMFNDKARGHTGHTFRKIILFLQTIFFLAWKTSYTSQNIHHHLTLSFPVKRMQNTKSVLQRRMFVMTWKGRTDGIIKLKGKV